LGNRRLVIVAAGALQYVPFAMLPTPVASGQWSAASDQQSGTSGQKAAKGKHWPPATDHRPLIVGHEIITLPSASTLAVMRRELATRQPAENAVALLADPVFSPSDARIKASVSNSEAEPPSPAPADEGSRILEHLAGQSADPTAKTSRLLIPRLPFTRQEADRILAVAPRAANLKAVDFRASKATVTGAELGKYRYVHFATHGYLDSERAGFSALVLSMVDEQGRPQDGFLRANEVYNLSLPAELVALSACQTGLGKEIKGEGLVGLTRGFMYAGAARVVVSLWSVNDKATSELMTKFYEKMLKQGARPAAALRAAQVEMWRQKQWQSPYYWAAFTMQGEWR
jgi:CHAT domain-containing protein